MDIGLPGKLSGYDLIRYIHKKKLNIPIIIQSTHPQCIHLQNKVDEDYVEKPINYDVLLSKINKYLFILDCI